MWNNAIWQKQGKKMEESFMTDDMVKNVKKNQFTLGDKFSQPKTSKKHNSISIRRQTQPTKNLKE